MPLSGIKNWLSIPQSDIVLTELPSSPSKNTDIFLVVNLGLKQVFDKVIQSHNTNHVHHLGCV
jgi:hypothetical protein